MPENQLENVLLKALLTIFPRKDQRLDGKFVSENVFSLSSRSLTEHEISVLDKELNFVPTPEKLDRLQIKNNLERLVRDTYSEYILKTIQPKHLRKSQPSKFPQYGLHLLEILNLDFILVELKISF